MNSSWIWAAGLLGLVIGVALGVLVAGRLRGTSGKIQALETELAQLDRQYQAYRQQVTQHFRTTSELVKKMADSYRDVYEHLAGGSQTLCQTNLDKPAEPIAPQPLPEAKRSDTDASASAATGSGSPPGPEPEPIADLDADEGLGDAPRVPELGIRDPERPPPAGNP